MALTDHGIGFLSDRVVEQAADRFDEMARRLRDQQVGHSRMYQALALRIRHRQQALQRGVDLLVRTGGFQQADEAIGVGDGTGRGGGHAGIVATGVRGLRPDHADESYIYLILLTKNIAYNARRNALTAPGGSGVQGIT